VDTNGELYRENATAPAVRMARYQLLERLARGGMAEVFRARLVGLAGFEKIVALKRILPELDAEPSFVAMFLDEVRLTAQLNHPNIVETLDVGRDERSFFYVMEYVPGRNLAQLQRTCMEHGERMPLGAAISIVAGAASGLHHAHEHRDGDGRPLGIVHRDVSPSNILVRHDGFVKVADFGIAKAASQHSLTRVGTIKGKLSYMSPEQRQRLPVDRRSDIFSLGIVLYEITTGRRLFRARDAVATLLGGTIPPPSLVVSDYPSALEAIVMRALEVDPARRFATAEELRLALEEVAIARRLSISTTEVARFFARLERDRAAIEITVATAFDDEPVDTEVDDSVPPLQAIPTVLTAPPAAEPERLPPLVPVSTVLSAAPRPASGAAAAPSGEPPSTAKPSVDGTSVEGTSRRLQGRTWTVAAVVALAVLVAVLAVAARG
jgi:serine/threonine-protein kinase